MAVMPMILSRDGDITTLISSYHAHHGLLFGTCPTLRSLRSILVELITMSCKLKLAVTDVIVSICACIYQLEP
jgi:hypothetical protein